MKFIGTWRLISQHNEYPDGRQVPARGENPIGILMYDGYGNVAVQLARTDKRANEFTDLTSLETAIEGYHGYFGTYEVNETEKIIRHTINGAAFLGYRGTVQVRHYEFEGDHRLILRVKADPERVLVWERVTQKL